MAQRTVALCDGKYIGIETIYTVINGQQINIPDKLKELRERSQRNELFCPCGCGANLILVAGDKNLREQHFREKNGTGEFECKMPTEGKTSVDSKIVLKCWLDDKLRASDIESRVPIDTVEDTKRKPEFTFLSKENKFAIRYWRTRANIMDDRLDVLTGNLSGIRVLYIVDESNRGGLGQYPEALMKIQDRQRYCLLLSIKEAEYDKATLTAVYYDKDIDERWREITLVNGPLRNFSVNYKNEIVFLGQSIEQIYLKQKENFSFLIEEERRRRIEAEKLRQENLRKIHEAEERSRVKREESEKRQVEYEKKKRLEAERQQAEWRQKEEEFKHNMQSNFLQQETPIRDTDGNRWVKCEFCGKFEMESKFISYGGANHVNLGTCKECSAKNPTVQQKYEIKIKSVRKKYDSNVCPECSGTLREKSGQFGRFIGCSNYPRCRYTRKISD